MPGLKSPESAVGRGEGVITRLCTAPLVVAPLLRETLMERMQTVILTSATLTVAAASTTCASGSVSTTVEAGRV